MLWAPGKEVDGGGGDHPMPTLAATTSNRDPCTEMVRLGEDARCSKLLASEKQLRHAKDGNSRSRLWITEEKAALITRKNAGVLTEQIEFPWRHRETAKKST
jgi:hypothetical protein